MQRKIILTICLVVATALSAFAGTTWYSDELPNTIDSVYTYDSSPQYPCPLPCEIFAMRLTQTGPATFTYDIISNFGNQAERIGHDPNRNYMDTIGSINPSSLYNPNNWGDMAFVPVGDLYIRVRTKALDNDVTQYALALESRTAGSWTDWWAGRVQGALGFTPMNVTAGTLYSGVKFATGTWEDYYANFSYAVPKMEAAQLLPPNSLQLTTKSSYGGATRDDDNSYPTTITAGEVATGGSGAVAWHNATDDPGAWAALEAGWKTEGGTSLWDDTYDSAHGYWTGSFTLPGFNQDTMYVDIWSSMACGNDCASAGPGISSFSGVVPLPGSLLLCGIGLGFAAVVRTLRKRSKQ